MYDDMGVPGEDPKWDIFAELHAYLGSRFPLVYVGCTRCRISTEHYVGTRN